MIVDTEPLWEKMCKHWTSNWTILILDRIAFSRALKAYIKQWHPY